MHLRAADAYGMAQKSAVTPRRAEGMAFADAAHKLDRARHNVDDYVAYADALRRNQILWTVMQADVSTEENRLPAGLKKKILALSLYVDKQTINALVQPGAAVLNPLIAINKAMAEAQFTTPE